jgi:hypothetical protein
MTTNLAPKPLQGPLRARINKLAHLQGQRHEAALKVAVMAQVQHARDSGATHDELNALVDRMETAK